MKKGALHTKVDCTAAALICTKMRRCTKIQVQMHSGCTQGRLQQVREHGIAHHKMHRDSVALLLLSSNREQESIDPCL